MKKILLTATAICMAFTSLNAAYATDIKTIIGDGNIEYSGTVDADSIGKDVFVQVMNKGVSVDETTWNQANPSDIVYVNTEVSDSNGNYKFNFSLTDNGLYPVIRNNGTKGSGTIEYIGYTNSTDFSNAINDLSGKTGNDIVDYINANKDKLAMYQDIFSLDASKVITLVESSINADSSFSDLVKVYVAASYENGEDVKLNDYINDILASNDALLKFYKDYNEAAYSARLKSVSSFGNIDNFYAKLREAVILENVKNNDGVAGVAEMLNNYARIIGISVNVTEGMADKVVGKAWSLTELAATLNTLPSETVGGGAGGSSSSSGGSSGWKPSAGGNTAMVGGIEASENDTDVFTDLAAYNWAKDSITALFNKGVVKGKGEGTFAPADYVAREELISMLVREIQLKTAGSKPPFEDVAEDAWYFSAVKTAYNSNISKGYSEQCFGIGDKITREDMAVMIYNALTVCAINIPETQSPADFADKDNISGYAQEAVQALQTRGIISGYEDNTFRPKNNATRAETAVILARILPYTQLGK